MQGGLIATSLLTIICEFMTLSVTQSTSLPLHQPQIVCASSPSASQRLLLSGRVLGSAEKCQSPILGRDVDITVKYDGAPNLQCRDKVTVQNDGELVLLIPASQQQTPPVTSRRNHHVVITLCADGGKCARRMIQLVQSEKDGVASRQAQEKVKDMMMAYWIGTTRGDGYYSLAADWCLKSANSQTAKETPTIDKSSSNNNVQESRISGQSSADHSIHDDIETSSNDEQAISNTDLKQSSNIVNGNKRNHKLNYYHNLHKFHLLRRKRQVPSVSANDLEQAHRADSDLSDQDLTKRSWIKSDTSLWQKSSGPKAEIPRGYKKNGWDDSVMGWSKKRRGGRLPSAHQNFRTDQWDDSIMSWMKRSDGKMQADMAIDNKKRDWEDVGMQWVKRDQEKRNWEDNVLNWIKRNREDLVLQGNKDNWDASVMKWLKQDEDKRNWEDEVMKWVKKDQGKRTWDDDVMGWMKRDNNKRAWEDDVMGWMKRDANKRAWEDVGMQWVKKDGGKREWEDVGMAWVKRADDSTALGDQQLKQGDGKREWEDVGMAWVKRGEKPKDEFSLTQ